MAKLKNFDFVGMALFTGSLVSILYGVTGGGILYSWSSGNILSSLIIGAVGVAVTMIYEGFVASNPMIPPRIFKDRTASLGYITTWCQALVLWAYAYFITLYVSCARRKCVIDASNYSKIVRGLQKALPSRVSRSISISHRRCPLRSSRRRYRNVHYQTLQMDKRLCSRTNDHRVCTDVSSECQLQPRISNRLSNRLRNWRRNLVSR